MRVSKRPRPVRAGAVAGVALGLLLGQAGAEQAPDAQALLMQMSRAVEALNYDGVFVYQRGGQTDSMRIIHRHDGGRSRERLVSLSGSAREVIRNGEQVVCIFPEDREVLVEKSRPRELFPATFHQPIDRVAEYYRFSVRGTDRVAGRSAWVVAVQPRGRDRYGYSLWIDEESKLLLKSNVIDVDGRVLEQVMFTQLELPARIPDEDLEPAISGDGYTWIAGEAQAPASADALQDWDVDWVPSGFVLRERAVQPIAASPMPVQHLVYSDGLAMVSVFVEPLEDGNPKLQGYSSMGAVNAFSTVAGKHQITVVGELPRSTVQRIAAAVVRRDTLSADR